MLVIMIIPVNTSCLIVMDFWDVMQSTYNMMHYSTRHQREREREIDRERETELCVYLIHYAYMYILYTYMYV